MPVWVSLKIYVFSLFAGFWILLKRVVRQVWESKGSVQKRDNPPPCLVDYTRGHHSYVKLKVSFLNVYQKFRAI